MNPVTHGTATIREALEALYAATGLNGQVLPYRPTKNDLYQPDAIIEIAANGHKFPFIAEVKKTERLQTLGHIKAQLEKAVQQGFRKHLPLLVKPFMTRQMAEECRQLDLPFIDTAGNAYIHAKGILFYIAGQPRPKHIRQTRYRANTATGLRIAFALMCKPELAAGTYREIADVAGVALGAIGPVLKDLEERGFLRKTTKQNLILQNAAQLFDEWLTHYPSTLRPKLHLRRYQADPQRLLPINLAKHHAYWGGEIAAERMTEYLKPERFTLYVRGEIQRLLVEARMRLDPNGNTEVLDAFWPKAVDKADTTLAPPFLVYADLMMAGGARNLETAKILYERYVEPALHPQ